MSSPSANPTYKLHYFNLKGLTEPIRYLFAYGNQKYEDIRVSREEWPIIKSTFPLGQLPVLEVDGHRVYQSISICRFIANRVGLAGKNDWENLNIDIAVDTINDFRVKIGSAAYETDEQVKEKKWEQVNKESIPFYLEKLDNVAKENNGHFALGRLTWADLYFAAALDYINFLAKRDLIANYPNLQAVVKNVHTLKSINDWLNTRPQTEF